jgi:hypothetical protein
MVVSRDTDGALVPRKAKLAIGFLIGRVQETSFSLEGKL